jgi:hypothetical protein
VVRATRGVQFRRGRTVFSKKVVPEKGLVSFTLKPSELVRRKGADPIAEIVVAGTRATWPTQIEIVP